MFAVWTWEWCVLEYDVWLEAARFDSFVIPIFVFSSVGAGVCRFFYILLILFQSERKLLQWHLWICRYLFVCMLFFSRVIAVVAFVWYRFFFLARLLIFENIIFIIGIHHHCHWFVPLFYVQYRCESHMCISGGNEVWFFMFSTNNKLYYPQQVHTHLPKNAFTAERDKKTS